MTGLESIIRVCGTWYTFAMQTSRGEAPTMQKPTVKLQSPSTVATSNPSASVSSFVPKSRNVNYGMTDPSGRSQAPGTATETATEQGLRVQGDVNILSHMKAKQEILCISYTEQCEMLAAGISDGTITMFRVDTGQYVTALRDTEMQQNPGPTTAIKHRPVQKGHPITQTITATYATGCVKCWHYPTGQCLYTIREKRQTLGLGYHPFLPKFVTVGDDTSIYLYDEETKIQERIFHASNAPDDMTGHTSRVFCACFNPKSAHEIISGGWDDTVQFWDTRQPYATRRIFGVHMCGDGIDISSNGKEILTCAWQHNNPLQIWDYGSGKLIATIEPDIFNSRLYCGKYINNVFILCGGGDPNLLRVVDLRSHTSVASVTNLPGAAFDIDISHVKSKRASKRSKISDSPPLPKMAFASAKKIYQIDIG